MTLSWLRCPLRLSTAGEGNRLKLTRFYCFISTFCVMNYAMNKTASFCFPFQRALSLLFFLQDWSYCDLLTFGVRSTVYDYT